MASVSSQNNRNVNNRFLRGHGHRMQFRPGAVSVAGSNNNAPARPPRGGVGLLITRLPVSSGLHWGLRIGQLHSAGLILIYAKKKEPFLCDASFYRRTGFDR
jgi:hypothetical protein